MCQLFLETSTKADGNLSFSWGDHDDVQANRAAFLNRFGRVPEKCVFMNVEHEDKINHVTSSYLGQTIQTEALITNKKGMILFLHTADCFPVVFYDPHRCVVALAHLGWKPTDKRLAEKVVKELEATYESSPRNLKVFIGPGIHRESYAFENPLQKQLTGWSSYLTDLPDGTTQIDLVGHIRGQLVDNGVPQRNIEVSPVDTATSREYFSHYRSTKTGELEGRFATIVELM